MRITIIATFLFFYSVAASQINRQKQLRFNHLFLKDGIIEAQVNRMEQDNEGYMLFGTGIGLVRFDGYYPKNYQFETKVTPRSTISAIYKNRKGGLWAAAAKKVCFITTAPMIHSSLQS